MQTLHSFDKHDSRQSRKLLGLYRVLQHNVVDRGDLQAMWEELAGQVVGVHHDQLVIC